MANIPVLDLRPPLLSIKDEVMAAIEAVVDGTAYINGPATQQFEKEAAAQVMSLPVWPELGLEVQEHVAGVLKSCL
jgi:dTDP-4-amino-4,6-dideoxygalactose transaminase